jgi:hypothetical protein
MPEKKRHRDLAQPLPLRWVVFLFVRVCSNSVFLTNIPIQKQCETTFSKYLLFTAERYISLKPILNIWVSGKLPLVTNNQVK